MIKNPVPWPNRARCAVVFTWDMDVDAILHLAHPNDADTRKLIRDGQYVPRVDHLPFYTGRLPELADDYFMRAR